MHRPRFSRITQTIYKPNADVAFQNNLSLIAKSAMSRKNVHIFQQDVKVSVSITRKFDITSRHFGDIDNHVKNILDALNGICWNDDDQVVEIHAFKFKGSVPSIEIAIEEF